MKVTARVNIELAKPANYIPMGFWVQPVAGDPKKPFYRITDLGIPMVKVADGTALGYSVYVLNVDVSNNVVPSGSNPQWRLIESTELIYIQQAFIERLWTQMLVAEGAEIGGFWIKNGKLESRAEGSLNISNIVLDGSLGTLYYRHPLGTHNLFKINKMNRNDGGVITHYINMTARLPTNGADLAVGDLYVDANGFVKMKT